MPLKLVTVNDNVFQILGDFIPRPPRLCSSKISLKNPLLHYTLIGVCDDVLHYFFAHFFLLFYYTKVDKI